MATENRTITKIFRDVSNSVNTTLYNIDDIQFDSSAGGYKILGTFDGIKSGGVITLVDCGDLSGVQKVVHSGDGYVVINSNPVNDKGTTGRQLKTNIFFFSEQYLEADDIVAGKGDLTPFIFMPIPNEVEIHPFDEPNLYVKDGEFVFIICTYGREFTEDNKVPIVKSEILEQYVSICLDIAKQFVDGWKSSIYCPDQNCQIRMTEKPRMDVQITSNDQTTTTRLFNAEFSGVVIRIRTDINDNFNCE